MTHLNQSPMTNTTIFFFEPKRSNIVIDFTKLVKKRNEEEGKVIEIAGFGSSNKNSLSVPVYQGSYDETKNAVFSMSKLI
jgi:hypothetical protein